MWITREKIAMVGVAGLVFAGRIFVAAPEAQMPIAAK